MAFPPPKAPKPAGIKQWAGAPPPKAPAGPPGAPPPPDPNQDPNGQQPLDQQQVDQVAPPQDQPANQADGDPQMMSRAHVALSRLLMDGGLSKEADALIMQAMQKLVEKKKGGPLDGASGSKGPPGDDKGKPNPFAKGGPPKPGEQPPQGPPGAPPQKPAQKAPPPFPPKK